MVQSRAAALISLIEDIAPATPPPLLYTEPLPHITVHEVSAVDLETLEGYNGTSTGIMQVNCYSKSYDEAYNLRDQVKVVFRTFTLGGMADSLSIQGVNHQLDRELWDGNREIHQHIVRYTVHWG